MRCEQCNTTFCSYRQTAGKCRFESVIPSTISAIELGRAGVGIIEEQYDRLRRAAARLAEAVLFDWENKVDIAREVAKMTTNWEDKK